ncbi:MAG: ribonuclease [Thermoleophilaceae bacterium]|nr:ribonuclease [Thermoleophilaceae bacterium]
MPTVAVLRRRGRVVAAEAAFDRGGRTALDGRARNGADVGDLVLLGSGKRGTRVVRVIGRADNARDVLEGLMLERGLRRQFPRVVEEAARTASDSPPRGVDAAGRRDIRDLPTFTIDPASARDFDDAVSAMPEAGGRTRVWVHIADVSAYVRPGSALEKETARRATSVYVPGTVEPMLPEALSNQACSLVPGEDRLAVTVEMEMDGADVVSAAFYRSLIRSDMRLTYEQVDRVFAGQELAGDPWAGPLDAARLVAAALSDRRAAAGALAIESSSEPSFEFSSAGALIGMARETQTESHTLIEQLMVLANEQVAGYLADRGVPTLYRVHEKPEPRSVIALADKLATLDVPTPPIPETMSPQQAGELVGEISQMVAAEVRRREGRGAAAFTSLVLRSLKQAFYTPENLGHAGLQSERYCHFTSPIRRYPDLVCHRALLASLGVDDAAPRRDSMQEAGEWCSAAERSAMEIERSADDICMAFLLQRELESRGEEESQFDGEVVGLIGSGAFIRFGEQGFEGFLPVRRMRDYWTINEEGTMLTAGSSGVLRLGDASRVVVNGIDPLRGRVDLVPAPD